MRINRNNGNKSLHELNTRTRPQGPGQEQRPDPQGQGPDHQGPGLEICPLLW